MEQENRLSAEDAALLEEQYALLFPQLYKAAFFRLENHHLAEDAVQETFAHAMQHIQDFRDSPNPAGWLFHALNYIILHMIRTRNMLLARNVPLEAEHYDVNAVMPDEVQSLNIDGDNDLILLNRYYNQGCSIAQLAEEAGISVEAMRMRMHRAKKRLQNDPKIKDLKNFNF